MFGGLLLIHPEVVVAVADPEVETCETGVLSMTSTVMHPGRTGGTMAGTPVMADRAAAAVTPMLFGGTVEVGGTVTAALEAAETAVRAVAVTQMATHP